MINASIIYAVEVWANTIEAEVKLWTLTKK
jgi:hypothetical protein